MPRNVSGVYSRPAGTTAVANTIIESSKFNQIIDDLVADANVARPITAGGTGAPTVGGAQANLGLDPKVVVSSKSGDYTALTTDNNAIIRFSAAATLTLPTATSVGANWHVLVHAQGGAVSIARSGSDTINGATSVTIPPGFNALIYSIGGTAFFATITDVSGKADKDIPFVDVASAATVDLGAASSTSVNITGTTGITSFGTSAPEGAEYLLKFPSALTITASASIFSYTNANIVTFPGMQMLVRREASAWRVAWITPRIDVSGGGANRVVFDASALTAWRSVMLPDANVDLRVIPTLPFTKGYESAEQVITSGGALTLSHGLGVAPKFVAVSLVCKTAEAGYAVGDVVHFPMAQAQGTTADRGLAVVVDATNLGLRYGSATTTFLLTNKTSGASAPATNANWRMIVRAYA